MKICSLTPVYMGDNSREVNLKNLVNLRDVELKNIDELVICDQNFQPGDYIEGFTYLNKDKPIKKYTYGVAEARNKLLEWFYNSDYDYAFFSDARVNCSKSALNSLQTIIDAIHNDKIDVDYISQTLGIIADGNRVEDKQRVDYKETIQLMPMTISNYGISHAFIANYNKKYGVPFYIEQEKVKSSGSTNMSGPVTEDIFFTMLIKKFMTLYMCPDLCINVGKPEASTWALTDDAHSVSNCMVKGFQVDSIIGDKYKDVKIRKNVFPESIFIPRVDEYKELVSDYKPRHKIEEPKEGDVVPESLW